MPHVLVVIASSMAAGVAAKRLPLVSAWCSRLAASRHKLARASVASRTATCGRRCLSTGSPSSHPARVLSGIQPTGVPHLGNYCGAISQWVALQDAEESGGEKPTRLYSVVDLHAITVSFDAAKMPTQVRSMVASLLGAGLDPTKNILFKQSDVHAHAELAWLLGCITPLGWLNRMTQFKQKAASQKNDSALGLLAYPVLMAADILLYRATHIPVGEDQLQHLELARQVAATFNDRFGNGKEVLLKPFPVRTADADLARIMSLRDPTKKMSKSDPSPMSRIHLTDDADTIRKKIMKAQTDAIAGISFDKADRPGIANLLEILSAVTDERVDDLAAQYADYQTGAFKQSVADAVIARVCPIGERILKYEADQMYIDSVLADGAAKASELAAVTMADVKTAMGL